MCGRYTLTDSLDRLQMRFHFQWKGTDYRPRYNIAPTQEVLAVTQANGGRQGETMRWGLIPSWAKDLTLGGRMINAKAETVAERPAFRVAFKKRRCLVLADGFYEWRKDTNGKTPMRMTLRSGGPFAFAGLWEVWKSPAGEPVRSCTVITTTANALVAPIHDRMPVILPERAESLWLEHELSDPAVLTSLLLPYAAGEMLAYPVAPAVNSVRNDDPALIKPQGVGALDVAERTR